MFDHLFFLHHVYPAFGMLHLHILLAERNNKQNHWLELIHTLAGGWTNPLETYESTWESSPSRGEN